MYLYFFHRFFYDIGNIHLVCNMMKLFTLPNDNLSGWIVVCSLGEAEILHFNLCILVG